MICFPNAKINLGLHIVARREDGYHDLETIFYPIKIKDALEIVPALDEESSISMSGKKVEGGLDNNLVWKAWTMIQKKFPNMVSPIDIYLHKSIPMGAGMGGGSSDGAAMLLLLNKYFNLNINKDELCTMALALGSDCPFFIYNKPQFAQGRGEILEQVDLDLSAYSLQLICPNVHISTAMAFSGIQPKSSPIDLRTIATLPIQDWKELIRNDFEPTIFKSNSEMASIKNQLYTAGAIYAAMSGSGSTIFGLFEKGKMATIQSSLTFESHYIEHC